MMTNPESLPNNHSSRSNTQFDRKESDLSSQKKEKDDLSSQKKKDEYIHMRVSSVIKSDLKTKASAAEESLTHFILKNVMTNGKYQEGFKIFASVFEDSMSDPSIRLKLRAYFTHEGKPSDDYIKIMNLLKEET
jgi:hypothetical protein